MVRCENVGLMLHPKKSVFGTGLVEFLGHMCGPGKLTPSASKLLAFQAVQPPTTASELRSAIGLFNYYRHFVPDAGPLMAPLNKLLTKESIESKTPFTKQWTPEQAACFEQLKENLSKPGLAIRHADFDRPFLVHEDWSKNGLGAILAQVDDGGNAYIVCCSSRSLNDA